MSTQHPITPPPELVASLRNSAPVVRDAGVTREDWLIDHAYAAGADQELEAGIAWLRDHGSSYALALYTARRPKAPTLKEQALLALSKLPPNRDCGVAHETIRAALEALPEPESTATQLAARPLLDKVARMADCIDQRTVGEIMAISDRAAAWLKANPPGQPVAIEPRGCPTPGACSCVEPVAQPEPVAPTDEEIAGEARKFLVNEYALPAEITYFLDSDNFEYEPTIGCFRAVLARWGTPTNTINKEDYDRG